MDVFDFEQLRKKIEYAFKLADLEVLCFDLGIEYDNLTGETLSQKSMALITTMRQQGQMSNLLAKLALERPGVEWPAWPKLTESIPLNRSPSVDLTKLDQNQLQKNPFGRTGKIEAIEDYLVRQPLTDVVLNELRKGTSLSIVGESQSGKSSLLWYLTQFGPQLLDKRPNDFVYMSMELLNDDHDFYEYLCAELEIETCRGFRLNRALKRAGRSVILCLDEIEKMTWDGFTHNVRTELRGLADGGQAVLTLVIASRSPLHQLFPDSPHMTSPLAGLCVQIGMPNFSYPEVEQLVSLYLASEAHLMSTAGLEAAWTHSAGHPRRLQEQLFHWYNGILRDKHA